MPNQDNQLPARPIENSFPLPTGIGFAGQYPRDLEERTSRKKIAAILDAGVTVFIDLTEPGESARGIPLAPYEHMLLEEAQKRNVVVERLSHSVPDQKIPETAARMRDVLDALDNADRRGKRVYLHCWGGKGRTGTAVACHLIRRGYSAAYALRTVQELARTMPQGRGAIVPENAMQSDFVRKWRETD